MTEKTDKLASKVLDILNRSDEAAEKARQQQEEYAKRRTEYAAKVTAVREILVGLIRPIQGKLHAANRTSTIDDKPRNIAGTSEHLITWQFGSTEPNRPSVKIEYIARDNGQLGAAKVVCLCSIIGKPQDGNREHSAHSIWSFDEGAALSDIDSLMTRVSSQL